MQSGLSKIYPHRTDFSLLHTFGALVPDPKSLPANFSIYDKRAIPNQELPDTRFNPPLPALDYGCTAESITFARGLEDNKLYSPLFTYLNTPPGDMTSGRDLRAALQSSIDKGCQDVNSNISKSTAYFNVYGAGAIDDYDAVKIALWLNQIQKEGVIVGSYWYFEFEEVDSSGILPSPSFNTSLPTTTMHCHLITGWITDPVSGTEYLEDISWQGEDYAHAGLDYISRVTYNALMAQPYTGAFTLSDTQGNTPVPIGFTAILDHLVYWLRQTVFNL